MVLIKMTKWRTAEEIISVENKRHHWSFKTGKMIGEEITLVRGYGDITRLPTDEVRERAGWRV